MSRFAATDVIRSRNPDRCITRTHARSLSPAHSLADRGALRVRRVGGGRPLHDVPQWIPGRGEAEAVDGRGSRRRSLLLHVSLGVRPRGRRGRPELAALPVALTWGRARTSQAGLGPWAHLCIRTRPTGLSRVPANGLGRCRPSAGLVVARGLDATRTRARTRPEHTAWVYQTRACAV